MRRFVCLWFASVCAILIPFCSSVGHLWITYAVVPKHNAWEPHGATKENAAPKWLLPFAYSTQGYLEGFRNRR